MRICEKCGREFEKDYRRDRQSKLKNPPRFCSRACANSRIFSNQAKEKKSKALKGRKIDTTSERWIAGKKKREKNQKLKKEAKKKLFLKCSYCGKTFEVISFSGVKKRKYCSHSCSNYATNPKRKGHTSKAEDAIAQRLESAGYFIERNRRDLLDGLEIDIWIPSLNVGVEYNGIYHFRPVHGEKVLIRVKENDQRKKELARQKGIKLFVLEDTTSHPEKIKSLGSDLLEKLSHLGAMK